MLAQRLAEVRARIARSSRGLNENNTKATLIEPVLRALGWNVEDVDDVNREYRIRSNDRPVDYALLVLREAKLFVEAKGLGSDLDDRRWANQIMGYAAVAGVEWVVLTNGDEWRIYNSHATVPVEQKLLTSVRISDPAAPTEQMLGLIAKDQIHTDRIDALWRAQFIDRQVESVLKKLFAPDEMFLVNRVREKTKGLDTDEIRGSLRRCKIQVDFPPVLVAIGDVGKRVKVRKTRDGGGASKPRAATGEQINLADLGKTRLVKLPLTLTKRYLGKDLTARIMPDGKVEVDGKYFSSLSTAGSVARASAGSVRDDGSLRATNGWSFWRYVDPAGKEQSVDVLRQELLRRQGAKPGAAAQGA